MARIHIEVGGSLIPNMSAFYTVGQLAGESWVPGSTMFTGRFSSSQRAAAACPGCAKHGSLISLQWCKGCEKVAYCSKACQLKDWIAGHKAVCKGKAAQRG